VPPLRPSPSSRSWTERRSFARRIYSCRGDVTTWKVGITCVNDDLASGLASQDIEAPHLQDLFAPASTRRAHCTIR